MDTDSLEQAMNALCAEWMHGKSTTDGVFGPVQAAARVFLFQALSAWTVLEQTGQSDQLAPDLKTWLQSIIDDELPYVRQHSSIEISVPKH